MGGHGGLNILPQKRWNVYRFDNIEKVRQDEEAAAREEQLKREQSRRRDSEFRLEQLRQARNPNPIPAPSSSSSNHMNLFENSQGLDGEKKKEKEEEKKKPSSSSSRDEQGERGKKRKREEAPVITPEDEKYKLGYGLVGKGVKAPWYTMSRPPSPAVEAKGDRSKERHSGSGDAKKNKKKSMEELREERMRRERKERDREAELVRSKDKAVSAAEKGFSRRRM
ncbi:leukocyte receptor cluster member 1-like protein [Iris pallida]|uniref:Leukocyte receptor cluster member 1-like protein n=1 Tax=Iris pallida TaxID=29817 RepID=A0AAX6FP07_IRIPA|nr:leukocyte receptor cluster member 1-like protein [Iris pallida]KAJ6818157.1 leukocyte receptor cluster member 1-like protein [Iris pallida]